MPTITIDGDQTAGTSRTYTMRELSQATARVIDEINHSGQPALVTKHGRFVALITPLEHASLESVVLKRNANELGALIEESADDDGVPLDEVVERHRSTRQ
jgi:antitoxin (DNA-binding transcriptional repressor) of toxin-antitoxin stability system